MLICRSESLASVESVKAASDVYCPFAGVVTEVNLALEENPGLVNEAPESDGWFAKLKVTDAPREEELMNETDYRAFCENADH